MPVASPAALMTSAKVIFSSIKRAGFTWICNCSTSPPTTLTSATPGTANSSGLSCQSAKVRSSIGLVRSEVRPIFNRSIVEETSGESVGALDSLGKWPATSVIRSASSWRSTRMLEVSSNETVTTDSPWMDSERTLAKFAIPLTAASIG